MKKKLILPILLIIIFTSFFSVDSKHIDKIHYNEEFRLNNSCYINITALEAWDLLNNTDDGRQIPIDTRRWDEYSSERIKPPNKEDWPRWFAYEFTSGGPGPIKNEGILLEIFMKIYQNKEIIIYCRTGRRTGLAAEILIQNGFEGTLYNMVNGITEWKALGLPTVIT